VKKTVILVPKLCLGTSFAGKLPLLLQSRKLPQTAAPVDAKRRLAAIPVPRPELGSQEQITRRERVNPGLRPEWSGRAGGLSGIY